MGESIFDYYETNGEKYQCLICGMCFPHKSKDQTLIGHLQKSHDKKLNIDSHLLNHFSKQGSLDYKCNYCERCYSSLKIYSLVLAKHIHKKHKAKASSDILKIVYLEKREESECFIADHIVFKTLLEKQCKYCPFLSKFTSSKHMIRHLMDLHKEIFVPENIKNKFSKNEYKCQFCGITTDRPGSLESHEATHLQKKRFFCHCKKGFVHKSTFTKHKLQVHSNERPYVCDVCGRGFKNTTNLKTHTRVHTGETPYQCKICEKKFKFAANRDNHKCSL